MSMEHLGCILLLVGGFLTLANWSTLVTGGSFTLPLGGLCLMLGLACFEATQSYAWLGLAADIGFWTCLIGLPNLLRQYRTQPNAIEPAPAAAQPRTETDAMPTDRLRQ